MQNIIEILEEKNAFLEKFYKLNEEELVNFGDGNFDNLDDFYNSREGLLAIIKKLDDLVERCSGVEYCTTSIEPSDKRKLIRLLDAKNELVTSILSQDLQALSLIESAKSEIIKELAQTQVTRKGIGSYKSGPASPQIDEKA